MVSQCSSVESGYSCGESSFGFGPRQPCQHHRGYLYAVVSQRIVVVSQCSSGESVYSCGESSFGCFGSSVVAVFPQEFGE